VKIIVCGGRDFTNAAFIWSWLDRLHEKGPITALMQGGARGVDTIASEWAATKPGIARYVCKADWDKHGNAAGPIRNARMLEWKPDAVAAFPGGRGTADMIAQALRAHVKIIDLRAAWRL
jgi:YspA, cpYpsA-related SLOG family